MKKIKLTCAHAIVKHLIAQKILIDGKKEPLFAGAFGIFGYSFLSNNTDKVKASKIDGVEISMEGIQDYSYPIARPLFFYIKKAHIGVIPGIMEYAKEFVYTENVDLNDKKTEIPIGVSCRTCDRLDCSQRAFPPLHKKFDVDLNNRGVSVYVSD